MGAQDEAAETLIDAIGEVSYTAECAATIDMARAVFNSLAEEEQAMVENYETLTAAEARYAELKAAAETPTDPTEPPTDPTEPSEPENPDDPSGDNLCKWCEKEHSGSFWQKIVGFFHSILYFFAHVFGRK